MECKCTEFLAAGWRTGKRLRLYQTTKNLTSGHVGIPLVVIRLGVTRLKKIKVVYLLHLFEGGREMGSVIYFVWSTFG